MANALTPDPSHRPEDVLMEEAFGTVRGVAREDLLEAGIEDLLHRFLVPYTI